jgi:colicin import membrane protein
LPHYSNSELPRFPSEKGRGIVGTVLIHLALLALLVFFTFTVEAPPKVEDEGIMVNFGTGETGLGLIEPSPPAVQEKVSASVKPVATAKKASEDPLITQNTEEAPAVKRIDPDVKKKRLEKIEADKKIREQLEAEKIQKKQEEIERKRVEAEQQRQTDIMNRTKNALANSKNAGTNSTSEGIAGGTGNQGDPNGSVDSKVRGTGSGTGTSGSGISYSLEGRGIQKLPKPAYDYNGGGRVVVDVSVDRMGKVIQAVPGAKGSTTLDEYLLKVAKDAAMQASFETKADAPSIQKGTITYNFILK